MWGMAWGWSCGAHLDGAGNALVLASEASRTRPRCDQVCGRLEATGGSVQRPSGGGGMAMEQTAAHGASSGSGVSGRGRQSLDCSGDGEELGGVAPKYIAGIAGGGGGGVPNRKSCTSRQFSFKKAAQVRKPSPTRQNEEEEEEEEEQLPQSTLRE